MAVQSEPVVHLNHYRYFSRDRIGRGSFGDVYKGFNSDTGKIVAVKALRPLDERRFDMMLREFDLVSKLKHKHILEYQALEQLESSFFLITEYCEGGSLLNIVKKYGGLNEKLLAGYVRQILEGLQYLHQNGVIHRDIKAANLLSNKKGKVKIADFGESVVMKDALPEHVGLAGTINWMAPEVVQHELLTFASDIWSLGMTIIELLTGEAPYEKLGREAAAWRIVFDDHPPIPEGISAHLRDFLLQCFIKDVKVRATCDQLLTHPWLDPSQMKKRHVPDVETKVDEPRKLLKQDSVTSETESIRIDHQDQGAADLVMLSNGPIAIDGLSSDGPQEACSPDACSSEEAKTPPPASTSGPNPDLELDA